MTLPRLCLLLALATVVVVAIVGQRAFAGPAATAAERATLACIRRVESRGRYHAVSRSGRYRNAYQMDNAFWRSNSRGPSERHWTGRHELAPPAVQDRVALRGLRARGLSPWPPARRCR